MGRRRYISSFTLLELIVVVTLLTIAVGFATVNLRGFSDRARLHAAATQIGSFYRVARLSALRSGMPCVLRFNRRECTLATPNEQEGQWVWSDESQITLVGKVGIVDVQTTWLEDEREAGDSPWRVMLIPGDMNRDFQVSIVTSSGVRASVYVDGYTGAEEVQPETAKGQ